MGIVLDVLKNLIPTTSPETITLSKRHTQIFIALKEIEDIQARIKDLSKLILSDTTEDKKLQSELAKLSEQVSVLINSIVLD
jgi:peptidoglycan hydrolase CwlO-like protein